MIRRPPRSTLFPLHDALPIFALVGHRHVAVCVAELADGVAHLCQRLARAEDTRLVHHLGLEDRKSTRLNSSHANISYAVFCLKKKQQNSTISPSFCRTSKYRK